MPRVLWCLFCCFFCWSCAEHTTIDEGGIRTTVEAPVELVVLGNVQDGGSPHIGCQKECCRALFSQPDPNRMVVSLGVVDTIAQMKWLFEATPDLTRQTKYLRQYANFGTEMPDGIFITHAHIGHYAGLMFLGREALGGEKVPVYAMPGMRRFLQSFGPWNQLIDLKNISLRPLTADSMVTLSARVQVQPFLVPHRDEYSETVGYRIIGPHKRALFIPDIDKWDKWSTPIEDAIAEVDYAFLDATFFDANELNNRDMSEIPHPFIVESMERFFTLSSTEKEKVHFIHLNHSNPALDPQSDASERIRAAGFKVARTLDRFPL
ncbi:MAG: MBL fold metallo-hydrolase [Bacteroidota bacterium]